MVRCSLEVTLVKCPRRSLNFVETLNAHERGPRSIFQARIKALVSKNCHQPCADDEPRSPSTGKIISAKTSRMFRAATSASEDVLFKLKGRMDGLKQHSSIAIDTQIRRR